MNTLVTLHEIIENFPLYKSIVFKGAFPRMSLAQIKPMNFFCAGMCDSIQTFQLSAIDNNEPRGYLQNPSRIAMGERIAEVDDTAYQIVFRCQKCSNYTVTHVLAFKKIKNGANPVVQIQKIGQLPSIEKTIDNDLKSWLSKADVMLYEKGLRCETNGFGIGAYSYFRRIVENNIEKILDDIAETSDSQELIDAISEAKKQHSATDRLEIVKNHTPNSLKPGGKNVFKIIYGALSTGLHGESDESCLDQATSIRTCLNFLIKRLNAERKEEQELASAINNITKKN